MSLDRRARAPHAHGAPPPPAADAEAAAATHDLPTPQEAQKDLIAIDKGSGAVETAALQDNTVNTCPPDNPGARECSVQCRSLCLDFLFVECCYEQGSTCFCDI